MKVIRKEPQTAATITIVFPIVDIGAASSNPTLETVPTTHQAESKYYSGIVLIYFWAGLYLTMYGYSKIRNKIIITMTVKKKSHTIVEPG